MWIGAAWGVWGLAMIAVFILAIRLSYAVERRSPQLENRSGVPRKAMLFHTIVNRGVAPDAETQRLRRRMNLLLLVNVAGFASMFVALRLLRPM